MSGNDLKSGCLLQFLQRSCKLSVTHVSARISKAQCIHLIPIEFLAVGRLLYSWQRCQCLLMPTGFLQLIGAGFVATRFVFVQTEVDECGVKRQCFKHSTVRQLTPGTHPKICVGALLLLPHCENQTSQQHFEWYFFYAEVLVALVVVFVFLSVNTIKAVRRSKATGFARGNRNFARIMFFPLAFLLSYLGGLVNVFNEQIGVLSVYGHSWFIFFKSQAWCRAR